MSGERRVVDRIIDRASGVEYLGIDGRVASEAEALANYGDKGRAAYGPDASAVSMLALIRRCPPLPVIVNTSRTGYALSFATEPAS